MHHGGYRGAVIYASARTPTEREVTTMATDPVCGMSVDEKSAPVRTTYAGQTYYFCSNECFQKFNANPKTYAKVQAKADA
jgi:YHS domain-containing protein